MQNLTANIASPVKIEACNERAYIVSSIVSGESKHMRC